MPWMFLLLRCFYFQHVDSLFFNAFNLSTSPRFGWKAAGHTALRQGAAGGVQSPQWQSYLAKNEAIIGYYDAAQDEQYKGPWHYANLENPTNTEKTKQLTWSELFQQWSPARYSRLLKQWQATPLSEHDLPSGPTVYDAVIESFNAALKALTISHSPNNGRGEMDTHEAAKASLGALAHYVGDLHMPLHATKAATWALWPPGWGNPPSDKQKRDIHHFIEAELFTANDWATLAQVARQAPPPRLTLQTLKPYLMGQLMASYLANFEIFQAQVKVLASLPNAERQPEKYDAYLKQALKPILARRFIVGQQTLTAIHNLLWQQAQQIAHYNETIQHRGLQATS